MSELCNDCSYRIKNPERETRYGFPCIKIVERTDRFFDNNKKMDALDKYRFSPSLFVKPEQRACELFQRIMVNNDTI